jgi:hypothetical protein
LSYSIILQGMFVTDHVLEKRSIGVDALVFAFLSVF